MDLELDDDTDLLRPIDEAAVSAVLALEPGTPEFADAFWASMTQHELPRESRAASRVAGLLAALLARLFDRRALASILLARAIEEV
ncbi:MAG: hypothetical protein PHO64_12605, partial [Thiomonas sp.]|nr:hypothetical protein [Thiomonas sp.]